MSKICSICNKPFATKEDDDAAGEIWDRNEFEGEEYDSQFCWLILSDECDGLPKDVADRPKFHYYIERTRVTELEGALSEAIECIESWAAYASEYFQKKHDLAGDLAKLRAVLQEKEEHEEDEVRQDQEAG